MERAIYEAFVETVFREARIEDCARLSDLLATAVRRALPEICLGETDDGAVADDLTAQGTARVGDLLTHDQIKQTCRHFETRDAFAEHVDADEAGTLRPVADLARDSHFAGFPATTVLAAPNLLEAANDPRVLAVAERYLGCPPTLFQISAWWSFPGHARRARYTQTFHRDGKYRHCKLFIYLTDVDDEAGPHEVVIRSHDIDTIKDALRRTGHAERHWPALFPAAGYVRDQIIDGVFADRIKRFLGPAGSSFLVNTFCLHRAVPPKSRPRLIAVASYGMFPQFRDARIALGPAVRASLASRLPDTPRSRFINRELIEFS